MGKNNGKKHIRKWGGNETVVPKKGKLLKGIVSIMLAITMVANMGTSLGAVVFAEKAGEDTSYVYTFPNGSTVNYFLDENQMPYVYENGEKLAIALSLPHLEITDKEELRKL